MSNKKVICEICKVETLWNPEFWEKINEQGVRNFPNLEKDIKATIINNLKSKGIPIMLNLDGSHHICNRDDSKNEENSATTNKELVEGDRIKILIKGAERIEEYTYLGVRQFADFSPKFLKLKKGNRNAYIQISEVQKIEAYV